MKRKKNLYNKIVDIDVIMNMYDKVIKLNTKNKKKIEEFENYYSENIVIIKALLESRRYVPGKYNIFFVKEPKLRIIMSQNIKDKVINHLVAKYFLVDIFESGLIKENCATRVEKGTHYALGLFKKFLNIEKNLYDSFYILKFDISKYFYNIDHKIVKDILVKKIKDKDILNILFNIIDSTDNDYVNKEIERLKNNYRKNLTKNNNLNIIKEIDSIPLYKKGKGFPIGNMTSQIIATFYLNELDHYIKEKLDIKYYVRYMDDGILIHHDKKYLKYCLDKIGEVLKNYKLELNKKTKIYNSTEEIAFLGFRFIIRNKIILKVSNQTKKRFKYKLKKLEKMYMDKLVTKDYIVSVTNSYKSHLKYGSCSKLINININKIDSIIKDK